MSYLASLELSNGAAARVHQPEIGNNDITRRNCCAFAESASVALRAPSAFLTGGTNRLCFKSRRVVFTNSECSPPFRRRRRNVGFTVGARHA